MQKVEEAADPFLLSNDMGQKYTCLLGSNTGFSDVNTECRRYISMKERSQQKLLMLCDANNGVQILGDTVSTEQ